MPLPVGAMSRAWWPAAMACQPRRCTSVGARKDCWNQVRAAGPKAARPSLGFDFLRDAGLLRYFPEIDALQGVPQDPIWHPEGDVWIHTLLVIDEAAALREDEGNDLTLMHAALCHDFGKPAVTLEEQGRVRSPGHEALGATMAREFLERLRAPGQLCDQVEALVKYHLAPALFVAQGATAKGYRRLARNLDRAGTDIAMLVRVARADHWGRTTDEARSRVFPAADAFLHEAGKASVRDAAPRDVVQGRHLQARGLTPGPEFGEILARCRDVQDETGWTDAEEILDKVLGDG